MNNGKGSHVHVRLTSRDAFASVYHQEYGSTCRFMGMPEGSMLLWTRSLKQQQPTPQPLQRWSGQQSIEVRASTLLDWINWSEIVNRESCWCVRLLALPSGQEVSW
jgi:hypothetical protein